MAIDITIDDEEVVEALDAFVESFDFTLPGRDGMDLGRNLADQAIMGTKGSSVSDGIWKRSATGKDPDGNDWKANEEKYARYKFGRYDVDRPGELGGQMLSETSLKGKVIVEPTRVRIIYGTGQTPGPNARNGVPLRKSERKATDNQKAEWFEESGRRFYEFDATIEEGVVALCTEFVQEYLILAGF